MRAHANTLFVTTQGAYVTRDHQSLRVKIEGKVKLTVPLHHLESVVCFGRVTVSPAVLATCGEHRLGFSFLSEQGRFLARVEQRLRKLVATTAGLRWLKKRPA